MKFKIRTDSPVMRFFSKIFCMVYLNLLWLVCSIPLVTVGASTAALYYTMMKVAAGDDYGLTTRFFSSFRRNLKQGIVLGVIALAVGALLSVDIYFYLIAPGGITSVFQVFQIILAVLYLMIVSWAFPILAKFDLPTGRILQSAFFLSIRYFGYTCMILLTEISITVIEFFFVPLLALWGMGLISFVNSICFRAVFTKFVPEDVLDPDLAALSDPAENPDPTVQSENPLPPQRPVSAAQSEKSGNSLPPAGMASPKSADSQESPDSADSIQG